MADTYTQLNIHAVFAVYGRENSLLPHIGPEVYRYISGILKNLEQYPLAVNGYHDHVHLFFELNPSHSVSEIMRIVKSNSSKWINERKYMPGKFQWQEGYGAFSYSRSQRSDIIRYIMNQEEHHKKRGFREEYLSLLKTFEIEYKEDYLFRFYD
jgi:putative transposase